MSDSQTTDEVIGAIVLAAGEPFYDIKNHKFYIGNGQDPISSLQSIGTDSLYSEYASKIGTEDSHPAVGATDKPVYVDSSGIITASNTTKGTTTKPIYMQNGQIKECTAYADASVASAATATDATNVININADNIKTDNGLAIVAESNRNKLSINKGSSSQLGTVKVSGGNGLSIDNTGNINLAAVSTTASGAMTSTDKIKLNGIATGATKVTISNLASSGNNVCTINVNGTDYVLKAPTSGGVSAANYVTGYQQYGNIDLYRQIWNNGSAYSQPSGPQKQNTLYGSGLYVIVGVIGSLAPNQTADWYSGIIYSSSSDNAGWMYGSLIGANSTYIIQVDNDNYGWVKKIYKQDSTSTQFSGNVWAICIAQFGQAPF